MARYNETITARTGSRHYDIQIGNSILLSLKDLDSVKKADGVGVIVSDTVYNLHRDYIEDSINGIDKCHLIIMDDKEEHKSYSYAEAFFDSLIKKGFSRKSLLVAIGGGVVGDFTGFIASLYMRGISVIQVPTTLLAMVDSSVGGKVAVNLSVGKNMVGAFHQPERVLADVSFIKSLPEIELKNGLAESLKHGIIGDLPTIEILENNNLESIKESDVIAHLIARSVMFKADVVERDEREGSIRKILNFGHTVGHAIESYMEYKNILHGEAVVIGIYIKLKLLFEQGKLKEDEFLRIKSILEKYDLLNRKLKCNPQEVLSHMNFDKKNYAGIINFVLVEGLGNPIIDQQVDAPLLLNVMEQYFQ